MPPNLFRNVPTTPPAEEEITMLHAGPTCRIERIVSFGHSTDWYDQDEDEWVAVLTGEGVLEFTDGSTRTLGPGDVEYLPSRCRHRVAATAAHEPTVWLAVFMQEVPYPRRTVAV
jgi:cupin 2 domain-containing protein